MRDILNLPPLEYIRSYVIFSDSSNIVEAAEKLKISQPLLSKQLQNLEELLGVKLFEFQGRKKILTTSGREIYEVFKRHLNFLAADLHQALVQTTDQRPLKIGGRREVLENLFLNLKYPGSLSYFSMDSDSIEKALSSRSLDLAISQKEMNSDRLIRKKLWVDEFVLCWNYQIQITSHKSLKGIVESLSEYRCFDYAESSRLENVLDSLEITKTLIQTTFSDWRMLSNAMKEDKAWGVMPIGYAKSKQLRMFELPNDLNHKSQFYLYYQKELSRVDWFSEVVEKIINLK